MLKSYPRVGCRSFLVENFATVLLFLVLVHRSDDVWLWILFLPSTYAKAVDMRFITPAKTKCVYNHARQECKANEY